MIKGATGQETPSSSSSPRRPRARRRLMVLGALMLAVVFLASLIWRTHVVEGAHGEALLSTAAQPDSVEAPTTASPTPSAPATWTPLPTVPAAARWDRSRAVGPSATPTLKPTPSPSPSPSATPTAMPTAVPPTPTAVPTTALTDEIIHILLIGGDRDYVLDMNTDTLIVAVVNRTTRLVSLLSIPRDLWVHIPTVGWGRINTAHRIGARTKYPEGGGPGLLMRTIEENLGIPIDHWVRVGYEGFARAVDELGGVDMVVPCRVNLRFKPPTAEGQQEIILEAGIHHLDGATALRYVRTRRDDTDFDRARRQQQFLKGVWYQFKSPDTLLKMPALWSSLQGAFATDLKLGDLLALAPLALELEPQRIRSQYIGRGQVESWTTPGGWKVLLPIPERVQQVIASLYVPLPPTQEQPAGQAARISVRNGTHRPQLALIASDQLRWLGLDVVDTGPADRADYRFTRIIVFSNHPSGLDQLARVLKVKPEHILLQPDPDPLADLQVILGADYNPCQ